MDGKTWIRKLPELASIIQRHGEIPTTNGTAIIFRTIPPEIMHDELTRANFVGEYDSETDSAEMRRGVVVIHMSIDESHTDHNGDGTRLEIVRDFISDKFDALDTLSRLTANHKTAIVRTIKFARETAGTDWRTVAFDEIMELMRDDGWTYDDCATVATFFVPPQS